MEQNLSPGSQNTKSSKLVSQICKAENTQQNQTNSNFKTQKPQPQTNKQY